MLEQSTFTETSGLLERWQDDGLQKGGYRHQAEGLALFVALLDVLEA